MTVSRVRSFVTALFRRRASEREMDEEWQFHVDARAAALETAGHSADDAKRQARLEFGDPLRWREQNRDERGLRWIQDAAGDVRFALRQMRRAPGFAAVVVATLAIGIGANTAVFTIANAVLFKLLPFDKPDRIVFIDTQDTHGRSLGVSLQDFEDWRRESKAFSALTLVFSPGLTLARDDHLPEQYPGAYISANGFDAIGQTVALGRGFRPEDDVLGAPAVAILSDSVWKSRYAGDPSILGTTVVIATIPAVVVGVMPPRFAFPNGEQVWLPMSQLAPVFRQRGRQARFFFAYGRLADGVSLAQAHTELAAISTQLRDRYPDTNNDTAAQIIPFAERTLGSAVPTLSWVLMGSVVFVLLIACTNVANLLLARSAVRAREIALRTALGASRPRIVRQLLVENLVLSIISGAAGLWVAGAAIRWFDANTVDARPYWVTFGTDGRIAAFFAALCLLSTLLFGLAPALHISKSTVHDVVKEGGRAGSGVRVHRWTGALVVSELALTLVLLAGAGFMMRSFLRLYTMDVGFDTSHLLTMRIVLPARKYPDFDSIMTFVRQADERLNTIPGVVAASTATSVPLLGIDSRLLIIEGRSTSSDAPMPVMMLSIGPKYFDTLGARLVRGRLFDAGDGLPGHEVAIVNQRLAAKYFPNEDPIGRRIALVDDGRARRTSAWATIVGVVPTIRQRPLQEAPDANAAVYIPHIQHLDHRNGTMILVRSAGEPAALTHALRQEIAAIDAELPLANVGTMDQLLAETRWSSRVYGTMFAAFAAIALTLAAVGLYAVTACSVAQRTVEIGIRRAVGATPTDVAWLIVRRVLVYITIGLPIGIAGAIGIGHLLASALVQTTATDRVALAGAAAILIVIAAIACLVPARRAMKLDPWSALHYE
jgi:putative ABC transport system permease protein